MALSPAVCCTWMPGTMIRILLKPSCVPTRYLVQCCSKRKVVPRFLSFLILVKLLMSSAAAWTIRSPRRCISACRPHISMAETDDFDNAEEESVLKNLLSPPKACKVDQMSSTDLAYIGDSVYELFMRCRSVWPPKRTSDLQNQVVALVRAEYQARLLAKLREDFVFTDKEQQVLSRGRNAVSGGTRNRRDPAAYQDATALEALIGYLYITDSKRCEEVLQWLDNNLNDN